MDGKPLRLVPLGGLGEFGLNALVLEWEDHLLLIDAGLLFPGAEMPGIDSIVPDFQYLAERRAHVRGHPAHARPRGPHRRALLRPPGGARSRLREPPHSRLRAAAAPRPPRHRGPAPPRARPARRDRALPRPSDPRRPQRPRQPRPRGRDARRASCSRAAISRSTPRPRPRSVLTSRRSPPGATGACACSSPTARTWSTRAAPGSEDDLVPAFEEVMARTRGRVLVSCFATSIPRMQRVADVAVGARTARGLSRPAHGGQRRRGPGARPSAHPRGNAATRERARETPATVTVRSSSWRAARASRCRRSPS